MSQFHQPPSYVQPGVYQQAASTTLSSVHQRKQPWKPWQFVMFGLLVGLVIVVSVPIISTHASSSQTTWAQAAWNRQRQGYNPYETVINTTNVQNLVLNWRDGSSYGVGTPIEVGGILYFGEGQTLLAVNATTNQLIWMRTLSGYTLSSPAYSNGVIFAGAGSSLYALKASTGAVIWQHATGSYIQRDPLWANGTIYAGSYDGHFYALNASSGALRWKYTVSTTVGVIFGTPATDNGLVYVGANNGWLYALNGTSGKLVWKYNSDANPIIANGLVYVGGGTWLTALNETTGALVWRYTLTVSTDSVVGVAEANNVLYMNSLVGPSLSAFNATTGILLWQVSYNGLSWWNTAPVIANGVVYIGGQDYDPTEAAIRAMDASNGNLLADIVDANSANVRTNVVIANGMLFFGTADDNLLWAYHLA